MKNQDWGAFRFDGERVEGSIYTAVELWCENQAAAKALYGPIASWDTSEITDMSSLFYDKADFNEDISRWDVSNVTGLWGTFNNATSFNGDISRWDVSNVTSLDSTFQDATSFNGDLSRWDVSNVTDLAYTFHGATSFSQQLGGSWSDITAYQENSTFGGGCPGSIV